MSSTASNSFAPPPRRYEIKHNGLGWNVVDTSIQGPLGETAKVWGSDCKDNAEANKIAHELNQKDAGRG